MAAHAHNEARLIPRVLERLNRGERIALVTDAGTPLVSDPGSRLVRSAREAGFRVTPVPGPSALTAALSAAGVDSTRFTFFGFLPRRGGARREALQALSALGHTGVLYEAPGRVTETLRELSEVGAGDRRCVVARELTKKFEEFREGTVAELAAFYGGNPPRGEVVILVAGGESKLFSEADLRHRVRKLREDGLSARDIAARLAAETGAARNVVYRMALES
jgi:16S rRNA (cytidine1402-2'-O)-methyltransferase